MKRYQECNKLQKILRHWSYILYPFIYIQYIKAGHVLAHSVAIAHIQMRYMKYYWTNEEILNKLNTLGNDAKRQESRNSSTN